MIYVFGIVNFRPLQVAAAAGRRPYLVRYQDIGAVVAEVSEKQSRAVKDNFLAHEQVIEEVMALTTILPMRFGTVFTSSDLVIKMLAGYYDQFKHYLAALEGRVEMGLKAIWEVESIESQAAANKKGRSCPGTARPAPGYAFLMAKKEALATEDFLNARARKTAADIHRYFAICTDDLKCRLFPAQRLFFNTAYLIKKESLAGFKNSFNRMKSNCPGLKFLLSGPWPPYNFIKITKGENFVQQGRSSPGSSGRFPDRNEK